jgi:D-glycero-D-manno-heptose 1,7-bisphosphate phosphatase
MWTKGYVFRRQDFQFIDGVFEVCRKAKELGYWIFVVTNRAGIGR